MNYELRIKKPKNNGYTIIETMIAVSLFLVVIIYGMGALLNSTLLQKKSQDMRSIMDNLSFILEDMSKNLRTGYDYHCVDDGNFSAVNPHSCASGGGISFKSSLGGQWVYKIESLDAGTTFNVSKSIDGGANWVQLNASEINFSSNSGFSVIGAEPPPGDLRQPLATIRLVGTITSENNVITPFSVQTSVSQRLIDISS